MNHTAEPTGTRESLRGNQKTQCQFVKSDNMEQIVGILLYNSFVKLQGLNLKTWGKARTVSTFRGMSSKRKEH